MGRSSWQTVGSSCPILLSLVATAAYITVAALEAPSPGFSQAWAHDVPYKYPGGSYKTSNIQNFPGSPDMAASLVQLLPGGLRSIHWHDTAEWAYVLNGTCRSTVIEAGGNRSTESFDYGTGDMWLYGANEAHMVQGHEDGCTYLAAYNSGNAVEQDAFSFSSWLATANQEDVAQALEVPIDSFRANMTDAQGTFLALGPVPNTTLEEYQASIGSPPEHPVLHTHRFELSNSPNITGSAGGYVKQGDTNNIPISGLVKMSGALVKLVPQGMRDMHWHSNANEWQFIINGTVKAAVNPKPGVVGEAILRAGDAGYAPRGAPHYFKNVGCTDAFVLLVFDAGTFDTLEVTHVTAGLPAQIVATDLNVGAGFAETFSVNLTSVVPPPPSTNSTACPA